MRSAAIIAAAVVAIGIALVILLHFTHNAP